MRNVTHKEDLDSMAINKNPQIRRLRAREEEQFAIQTRTQQSLITTL